MNKFIGLFFTLLTVGCATNTMQDTQSELEDKWELITLDGQDVISNKPIVLTFKENSLTGNTGCNQVNGLYMVEHGTQIKFENLATTRMMCEDNQMKLESDILEMLETAGNYTINGDELSLSIGKRAPIATFHRMSDKEIVGKYWKLIELDGQKVSMADNQERERFFTMKSDGTLHGFAGCNTFSGSYELKNGKRIQFSENMAMTMRACPDVNVNEQKLMEVFDTADNYTISEDKLYLNVGRRMPLAVFEAVYF